MGKTQWGGLEGVKYAVAITKAWLIATGKNSPTLAAQLTTADFRAAGLGGMLQVVYRDSVYAALHAVLPDIQPWQMRCAPRGTWRGPHAAATARAAMVTMLIGEDLVSAAFWQWRERCTKAVFQRYGLAGMLHSLYGDRPAAALADLLRKEPLPRSNPKDGLALFVALHDAGLMGLPPHRQDALINAALWDRYALTETIQREYQGDGYAAAWSILPLPPRNSAGRYPYQTWAGPGGRVRARVATNALLVTLNLETADQVLIHWRVSSGTFRNNGLGGMLSTVYGGSGRRALADLAAHPCALSSSIGFFYADLVAADRGTP